MVKLFYADIEPLKNTCWRDVLPALPLWRQKRTLEMARDPDAARAAGAGLVYVQAMESFGLDPMAPVTFSEYGQPQRPDIFFSLSHAGPWCVCAAAPEPVGADVEAARCSLAVAKRFFPVSEYEAAAALEGQAQRDYLARLWTCREAVLKALGTGVLGPGYEKLEIQLTASSAAALRDRTPMELSLREFRLGEYYLALACRDRFIEERPVVIHG